MRRLFGFRPLHHADLTPWQRADGFDLDILTRKVHFLARQFRLNGAETLTDYQGTQGKGERVAFSIGDQVACSRFGDRVGRIVRVRKLCGMCLIEWSRNFRSWIDEDELTLAPVAPSAAEHVRT